VASDWLQVGGALPRRRYGGGKALIFNKIKANKGRSRFEKFVTRMTMRMRMMGLMGRMDTKGVDGRRVAMGEAGR
jgi:hypothetical protein